MDNNDSGSFDTIYNMATIERRELLAIAFLLSTVVIVFFPKYVDVVIWACNYMIYIFLPTSIVVLCLILPLLKDLLLHLLRLYERKINQ